MRFLWLRVAGVIALAWFVAFVAGSGFNQHHAVLVVALSLMWWGWVGFVRTMRRSVR